MVTCENCRNAVEMNEAGDCPVCGTHAQPANGEETQEHTTESIVSLEEIQEHTTETESAED